MGGTVFEWNDEWWKVQPAGSQQPDGFACTPSGTPCPLGAHPDNFANEEYFGIVDINRQPRQVYNTLQSIFRPNVPLPPQMVVFRAVSVGTAAGFGFAQFYKDSTLLYNKNGGDGGGRGFNIAVIEPGTGELTQPVQNFDTYGTSSTGMAMTAMIAFLKSLPNGLFVLVAVGDEAGLNLENSCQLAPFPWVTQGLAALEALGSAQLQHYCYRDSWAMVAVTGEGRPRDEQLASGSAVSAQTTITLP